jgi:Sulfotransferase domain
MLTSFVKANPTLYKIWFKLIRKRQKKFARLPERGDGLFFSGFPRSGNTYFNYLLRFNFPSLVFASHLHTIASLKIAFKKELKVLVIIRNPFDSITSLLLIKSGKEGYLPTDKVIRKNLLEFQNYYDFLIENENRIFFIFFQDMIEDKLNTMKKVINFLGIESKAISESTIEQFNQVMLQAEKKKDVRAGSFPNEN